MHEDPCCGTLNSTLSMNDDSKYIIYVNHTVLYDFCAIPASLGKMFSKLLTYHICKIFFIFFGEIIFHFMQSPHYIVQSSTSLPVLMAFQVYSS